MSTVNIVMATYNGEKYIKEQIESILGSNYTDWSLFIFDDGSTDATFEIAKSFEAKFPERIRVNQNKKNLGSTLNFLNGLKKVYEETSVEHNTETINKMPYSSNYARYYMFCDQDDVWNRDKIKITLERMKFIEKKFGKEKAHLVFTDTNVVDEKLELIYHSFFRSQCLYPYHTDLAHMLMENKCIGCTIMVNRAMLKYLDTLPEKARLHDWWLGLIASSFGHISYISTATLKYRQHGNNVVGSTSFQTYIKDRVKSLKHQKQSIQACFEQGREFLKMYESELSEEDKKCISQFVSIADSNWLRKRYLLMRYGFLKSGLIRNIGLLIII